MATSHTLGTQRRIPVTVLSGFLGSGKTTLVNKMLLSAGKRRIAVIVNDMSEINVDAELIRGEVEAPGTLQSIGEIVELTNGCICCTLRDEFINRIKSLTERGGIDHIIVEGTGIAEPLPVAAAFEYRDDAGEALNDTAQIDAMITVVDAVALLRDYTSVDFLKDRGEMASPDDSRLIVDLLIDQIEFADIIILNKVSGIDQYELSNVMTVVRALNADAQIMKTDWCDVAPEKIFNIEVFSLDKAKRHSRWIRELNEYANHVPEADEYDITSFTYRSRQPLNAGKFQAFLQADWPGLIRAKGLVWISDRPSHAQFLNIAGGTCRIAQGRAWWATTPREVWPRDQSWTTQLEKVWRDDVGDRRVELVFIGQKLAEDRMRAALDDCLDAPQSVSAAM